MILIPHAFLASPPAWLSAPFRFAPGGRHADGLTENALVLLADGSYLEFIAFVPEESGHRHRHRWGRKTEGTVIDWALTLHASGDDDGGDGDGGDGKVRHAAEFREIQNRVERAGRGDNGIAYADPVRGGRLRPDGVELRWAVASARRREVEGGGGGGGDGTWGPVEPGQLPFWCLDETPRRLRVPFEEDGGEKTRHPTGVVGVAEVEVGVGVAESGSGNGNSQAREKEALAAAYEAVFGKKSARKGGEDGWEVETVAGGGEGGRRPLHPPGRVVLSTTTTTTQEGGGSGSGDGAGAGAGGSIKITFYTDDEAWVGKTIGGKVDDQHTLEFKLVAATPKEIVE